VGAADIAPEIQQIDLRALLHGTSHTCLAEMFTQSYIGIAGSDTNCSTKERTKLNVIDMGGILVL
jgi:hypothetical protein